MCIAEDHSTHAFHPLRNAAPRLQEQVIERVRELTKREKDAENAVASFGSARSDWQEQLKVAEEDLTRAFEELRKQLREKEEGFRQDLHDKAAKLQSKADKEIGRAKAARDKFRKFREVNEDLLDQGTEAEVALQYKRVCGFDSFDSPSF